MIASGDIRQLAGLLEGEGSFGNYRGSPCVQMQSTDKDVLEWAATLLGTHVGGEGHKPKGPERYKRVWKISIYGTNAIGWMMTLYKFMGERRKAAIKTVIDTWKASDRMPRASRGTRFMATCHPDRVRCGKGLCRMCYMRQYREARA